MYKVTLEKPARSDLRGIHSYIKNKLKAPEAARRIYQAIKAQVKTLDQNPLRCKLIDEEPFRSKGVRPLYVENFTAFFVVDEANKKVHILRILYSHMQWQDHL